MFVINKYETEGIAVKQTTATILVRSIKMQKWKMKNKQQKTIQNAKHKENLLCIAETGASQILILIIFI